mmetsp:Transcript_4461/g.4998  ORF Transcript_4461/g.4998 Transcript_4461/m.4998 type:complete len:395 (-) Transcript_4461:641-1825(-)
MKKTIIRKKIKQKLLQDRAEVDEKTRALRLSRKIDTDLQRSLMGKGNLNDSDPRLSSVDGKFPELKFEFGSAITTRTGSPPGSSPTVTKAMTTTNNKKEMIKFSSDLAKKKYRSPEMKKSSVSDKTDPNSSKEPLSDNRSRKRSSMLPEIRQSQNNIEEPNGITRFDREVCGVNSRTSRSLRDRSHRVIGNGASSVDTRQNSITINGEETISPMMTGSSLQGISPTFDQSRVYSESPTKQRKGRFDGSSPTRLKSYGSRKSIHKRTGKLSVDWELTEVYEDKRDPEFRSHERRTPSTFKTEMYRAAIQKLERRNEYKRHVKENHSPSIDEAKQLEISLRRERIKNTTSKKRQFDLISLESLAKKPSAFDEAITSKNYSLTQRKNRRTVSLKLPL